MTLLGCIAEDCAFETVCETCVHLASGPEFVPILLHRRDHAAEHDQHALVTVYDRLLNRIDNQQPNPPGCAGGHAQLTGSPARMPICVAAALVAVDVRALLGLVRAGRVAVGRDREVAHVLARRGGAHAVSSVG
jgi:hypothetical protein